MYRFIVNDRIDNSFLLSSKQLQHIKVLRLNNEHIICLYKEIFYECELIHDQAQIVKQLDLSNEYLHEVILCASIIKFKKFEWLLQKSVELGVTKFIPLITKNTNAKLIKNIKNKYPRWEQIILSATEQSFRNKVMLLDSPTKIDNIFDNIKHIKNKFVLHEKEKFVFNNLCDVPVVVLVGPEGGFTDEEIQLATTNNVKPISLGPRILRAETASLSILSKIKV